MSELVQLKKTSLYQQAIDSLLNYIIVNDLKEGDRLPAENQLKDTFGISRNTLREAIKSLQMIGLIDTKQNSGIVIKSFSISDLTKFVPYALNVEDKELTKLYEAREWLEYSLLPMIVEKRTDEDLVKILTVINEMDKAINNNQNIIELDYQFHQTLIACCENSFIENISIILREFFTVYSRDKLSATSSQPQETDQYTNEEHKIIYKCIVDRNLPVLQKIYKKHLAYQPIN